VLALRQLSPSQISGVLKKIKELGAAVLLKVTTKDAPTFAMSIIEFIPEVIRKIIK
jgi:hypothetical protein